MGGYGGSEFVLPASENVEWAFDEKEVLSIADMLTGSVEAEENAVFSEDGGFWGVNILSLIRRVLFGGEFCLSSGKSDGTALDIANGDDEASAESRPQGYWVSSGVVGWVEKTASKERFR